MKKIMCQSLIDELFCYNFMLRSIFSAHKIFHKLRPTIEKWNSFLNSFDALDIMKKMLILRNWTSIWLQINDFMLLK